MNLSPRATNGLLTKIGVVWQKSDFLAKNRDFGPKIIILSKLEVTLLYAKCWTALGDGHPLDCYDY